MSPTAPIPTSLIDAYAAAKAICQRHAKSFHFASRFLPRPKRDHAYAVYAFCRLLDDAADEEASPPSVERFERTLDSIYGDTVFRGMSAPLMSARDGRKNHERGAHATEDAAEVIAQERALDAFAHTVRACDIPKRYFLDLAAGCRMDFAVTRYDTWQQLENYCYHVAGVVGLIMCRVFDLRDERAQQQAIAMGNAMQLTNILRDVREDLDRGRVYLPREDLDRFGISDAELETRRLTPQMSALVAFEIARARSLYVRGAAGLCALPDDGSRLTACVMSVVYSGILDAIETHRLDVFAGRAKLSMLDKLARLPKAWRLAHCECGDDVPDVF